MQIVGSIVLIANALFLLIDLFLVPGIFGGKDGWLEFWTFIYVPMSLIVGIIAARLINKKRLGY